MPAGGASVASHLHEEVLALIAAQLSASGISDADAAQAASVLLEDIGSGEGINLGTLLANLQQLGAGGIGPAAAALLQSMRSVAASGARGAVVSDSAVRHAGLASTTRAVRSQLDELLPSSFEPIVHHPIRRALALLFADGHGVVSAGSTPQSAISRALVVDASPDAASSDRDSSDRDSWPALLAAFLREGTHATAEAPMVSAPAHFHGDAPYGAFSARRSAGTTFGDARGALRQQHNRLSLHEVNPCHLLLLASTVAPSPAHLLQYACLCFAVAAAQAGLAAALEAAATGVGAESVAPLAIACADGIVLPFASFAHKLLVLSAALGAPAPQAEPAPRDGPLADAFRAHLFEWAPRCAVALSGEPTGDDAADACALVRQSASYAVEVDPAVFAAATGAAAQRAASFSAPPPSQAPAQLIELPAFDELYAALCSQECPACRTRPENLMLCLVCGQLMCAFAPCCRARKGASPTSFFPEAGSGSGAAPPLDLGAATGECTRHAILCGGGSGVQLMVASPREASSLWLLRGEFACPYPSIYVDAHGEEDRGLKRGKPLRLDVRRYRAIADMWRQGGVGREVTRTRAAATAAYRESVL